MFEKHLLTAPQSIGESINRFGVSFEDGWRNALARISQHVKREIDKEMQSRDECS